MSFIPRALRSAALAAAFFTLAAGAADAAAAAPRPPVVVPEPAMLALLGLGLIAVALVSRRR